MNKISFISSFNYFRKEVKLNKIQAKISDINKRIESVLKNLDNWLYQNHSDLVASDEDERLVCESVLQKCHTWNRDSTKIFNLIIQMFNELEMFYEANTFTDNIKTAFTNTVLPRSVRSSMIRVNSTFLRSVYKHTVQQFRDDKTEKFCVEGPTFFELQNQMQCNLRFFIVGPTMDQIELEPAIDEEDSTMIRVDPGWYSIICEPRDYTIHPLILEGKCLPGNRYPISLITSQSAGEDYKPSRDILQEIPINWGLFGAIDIDPEKNLYLSFQNKMFKIGHYLGEGSGGIVYQVIDDKTKKEYAFKFMVSDQFGSDFEIIRGREEWKNFSKFVSTENIVKLFDYSDNLKFFQERNCLEKHKNIAAYQMEFAPFGNLRNYVDRYYESAMSYSEILKIIHQICIGLSSIHKTSLIHRDVRPENVLVFKDDPNYRVCDFTLTMGKTDLLAEKLAKIFSVDEIALDEFEEGRTVHSLRNLQLVISSSTFYAAPEEHEGKGRGDQRGDIYSLGGIMYWLLFGHDPFVIELSELDQELYIRYKLASEKDIIRLDKKKRKELFGELNQLQTELRDTNLKVKQRESIEIEFDNIECPDLSKSKFEHLTYLLKRTLHPDPNERFKSANEMIEFIKEAEA